MMSTTINIDSAGGHQAGPGNPPEQPSPDGCSAGAQYLQAPNSSTPQRTTTTINDDNNTNTNTTTFTRQDCIDLSSGEDTIGGLSDIGKLQLYETDEKDIVMVSSESTVVATSKSDGETKDAPPGDKKKKKTDEQKREEGYKRSLRFLRKMESKDFTSLTTRDKRLIRKHTFHVKKYESLANTTVVEVRTPTATKDGTRTGTHATDRKNQKGDSKFNNPGMKNPSDAGGLPSTSTKVKTPAPGPAKGINAGPKPCADSAAKTTLGDQWRANLVPMGKGRPSSAKTSAGGKRQRSGETRVPEGKRVKKSTSLTSAPELQVAILDRSDPDGRLSPERWLILEEKILRCLLEALEQSEDDSFAEFDGAKWQRGVKIVGCGNKKALDFLKASIGGLDSLWPGMKVDVVPIDQIPSWTTVRVWVPPPILEDEAILTLVKRQNKGLNTLDWKIVRGRARDKGDGKDLWIRIGSESLRLLKLSHGVIKYGLNQLRMMIPEEKKEEKRNATVSERPEAGAN